MRTSRTRGALAVAVAALLLAAGCSGGNAESEGGTESLGVNWGSTPTSWAPGASTEVGYMRVPYENLVQLGADREIEPMLATAWEQDDDSITLELRNDVTFHDGTPFNAEAVAANLEYIRDNPGPYSGPMQVVESIDIIDEYTAQINLRGPAPSFLTMLTQRNAFIASPTALADGSIVETPVGTGPWAYDPTASIEGTKWVFTGTDDYWGESPGFSTIELFSIAEDTSATAAVLSGEIDITDTEEDQLPRFDSAGNAESIEFPATRNNITFFDRAPGGVFGDADVRKAMCSAISTDGLVALGTGVLEVGQQPFVEGEPGYNPEIVGYSQDVNAAQQLLGGATVTAQFPAPTFLQQNLEYYADQLNALDGVDISLQSLTTPQFVSTWSSGQYALAVGQNNQLTPFDWYSTWFAADGGANPSGYESPALKAAADEAIAAGQSEEADALWQEVMRIIIDEEADACVFSVGSELLAWNTDTVQGVAAPSQPYEPLLVNYRDLEPVG